MWIKQHNISLKTLIQILKTRKTTEYFRRQGFKKPPKDKWTYLSHSNEKWQYTITQSDAKLLNAKFCPGEEERALFS